MQSQNTHRKSNKNSRKVWLRAICFGLMSASTSYKKCSISRLGVLFLQTSFTFWRCGKMIAIRSILTCFFGRQHYWVIIFNATQICLKRGSLSLVLIEYSSQKSNGSIILKMPGWMIWAEGSLIRRLELSFSKLYW